MSQPCVSRPVFTLTSLWSIAVLIGMGLLWKYSNQPGQANAAPSLWPAESLVETSGKMTLLMAVHPKCPCTHSSVSELARLMRYSEGRLDCVVLINQPDGVDSDWSETGLSRRAQAIPGVRIQIDDGGDEARRHGLSTSGGVVVYDAQGRLRFSGGITPSRGHEGMSAGHDAILALIEGSSSVSESTPVYGCSLQTPDTLEAP